MDGETAFYNFLGVFVAIFTVITAIGIYMSLTTYGPRDDRCKEVYGSDWTYSADSGGCIRVVPIIGE